MVRPAGDVLLALPDVGLDVLVARDDGLVLTVAPPPRVDLTRGAPQLLAARPRGVEDEVLGRDVDVRLAAVEALVEELGVVVEPADAAPRLPGQVGRDRADVVLWRRHFKAHDRLQKDRLGPPHRLIERQGASLLKRDIRAVAEPA